MVDSTAVRSFSLRLSVGTIGVVVASLALLLLVKPVSLVALERINGAFQWLGPLLMLLLLGRQAYRLRRGRAATNEAHGTSLSSWMRWSPVLLGCAVASGTIAQFIFYVVYPLTESRGAPFPSWSDALYLSVYAFALAGLLMLPTGAGSLIDRVQRLLDGLTLTVAIAAVSWYVLVGPIIYDSTLPLLSKFVGLSYPVGDLIILFCLLILWVRTDDRMLRRIMAILTAGLMIIIVADTLYIYQTLNQSYRTGTLLDVSWVLGYMVLGLSAQILLDHFHALAHAGRSRPIQQQPAPATNPPALMRATWLSYVPYGIVPILGLFFFALRQMPEAKRVYLGPGIEILFLLGLGLIIARQFLALHENRRLHRALALEGRQLAAANEMLTALATRDPLTDLPNHRASITALEQESEHSTASDRPFSVFFVDVDHFKSINDVYGHAVGDALLTELTKVMRANLRDCDFLGRWGGEEFLVILPELEIDDAMRVANRLRTIVAQHLFVNMAGGHVTCSIGVASYPLHACGRDCLIDVADRALSTAKRSGRNQCRRVDDPIMIALLDDLASAGSREQVALAGISEALGTLIECRDQATGAHIAEVSRLTRTLATRLGLSHSEAHMLSVAGRLHDIGKIGVPDSVLHKTGRLTAEEWDVMCSHAVIGAEIISRIPVLRTISPILRGHHERWDGRGYPDGLAADAIPFGARVLAVVDAYGAMTSNRPYRPAQSKAWAIEELQRNAGTQFDPAIVAVFCEILHAEEAQRPTGLQVRQISLALAGD